MNDSTMNRDQGDVLQKDAVGRVVVRDPVFVRTIKGMTRRTILRRVALTAVAAVALTVGEWPFVKPLLVYARSCDLCVGGCSACASYLPGCPSPTGVCNCPQAACVCWSWENQEIPCTPFEENVIILSCEFPCGCQAYCEAC
jgi:hypothetical protein